MRVDFVIGGTQKGGTSALDSFLRQHPEICLPETKKELHYFDNEENFAERRNYKKYHTHFQPGTWKRNEVPSTFLLKKRSLRKRSDVAKRFHFNTGCFPTSTGVSTRIK